MRPCPATAIGHSQRGRRQPSARFVRRARSATGPARLFAASVSVAAPTCICTPLCCTTSHTCRCLAPATNVSPPRPPSTSASPSPSRHSIVRFLAAFGARCDPRQPAIAADVHVPPGERLRGVGRKLILWSAQAHERTTLAGTLAAAVAPATVVSARVCKSTSP